MPAHSRFNVPGLRFFSKSHPASAGSHPELVRLSRRDFLGFSAVAGAPAAIPAFLYGDGFAVAFDHSRIVLSVHGEPRWIIDAAKFGPSARVGVRKSEGRFKLNLINALFPGTGIPADFEVYLAKKAGPWTMAMVMECGIRVDAPLLPWLSSEHPAHGAWGAGTITPCRGFELTFRQAPEVQFTPNWVFGVSGPAIARVDGLSHNLNTDSVRIDLNPNSQIASGTIPHKTLFQLQRGRRVWHFDWHRNSEQGWSLDHDDEQNLFDEFLVETGSTDEGQLHSALLKQADSNSASIRLVTGGGLVSDSGEPFHLTLDDPRLAFSLNESPVRSALVADLSTQPKWAHGEYASYSIAGDPTSPHFEWIDDGDQSKPPDLSVGLCQVCFPADAVAMNLKFGVPKPFRLTWADIASPFERLWGTLHLLPSRHAFDIYFDDNPTPDHVLEIERPEDLLSLRFQFKNMRLVTGADPHIILRDKDTPGQITVIFPPQHVAEEAFFHTDDNLADPNQLINIDVPVGDLEMRRVLNLGDNVVLTPAQKIAAKKLLDPDYGKKAGNQDGERPRTLLSGDSRIVFAVPKGKTEIGFHLENLLDWKNWEPRVAEVAKTQVDTSIYKNIPPVVEPKDVTAIEIPYNLILSPSETGRWAHSLKPVKHETNVVELWHTRLAVAAPPAAQGNEATSPDETNTKDRIVRAIWSPDFVPVDRSCTPDPNMVARSDAHPDGLGFSAHYTSDADPNTFDDPFRMTLDSRDRCELVHLTSNYRIPKPSNLCVLEPTKDQLLPPAPVAVDRMMLTSIGGYLKSYGFWEPAKIDVNHQLTVEQWRNIATLGRDHYVRVVYKGYLLPFGHRASLVKVTERKIVNKSYPKNGFVAILHQRMFIVVQHPIKDFPVLGQPFGGRQIPFRRIEALTLITPDIDAPQGQFPANPKRNQTQSLFWPKVTGLAFPFRFRFTDMGGGVSEASLPVVFADAAVSQNSVNSSDVSPLNFGPQDAIDLYNAGTGQTAVNDDKWTTASFSDQKVAFAAPTKPGDTQYDASILAFGAIPPPASINVLDLYANDLPYFYPNLTYARITSSSIKRVTGKTDATRVVFFPSYISNGFDPQLNRGEVVLQVYDESPLTLAFGTNGNVDKAGGLASPDTKVAGFSRKSGPVGGTPPPALAGPVPASPAATASLTTYSSGNFNAGDFFGGLTSAKILGGIKLSDIIAPLSPGLASNLEKAPQMLEQSVFAIENAIEDYILPAIRDIQTNPLQPSGIPNPLAAHLASQAQQVYALDAARIQAHNRTSADPQGSLALLSDTVTEADVDRQLVGAIKDYTDALVAALSNPVALAEEALVDFLTGLLSQTITSAGLAVETQFANFVTALQNDLQPVTSGALAQAIAALQAFATAALPIKDDAENRLKALVPDTLRKLVDQNALQATLPLSQCAPDLVAVCNVIATASDLEQRVHNLPTSVVRADIPGFFHQLNGILDDLLQIYESAGFLGVVTTNPSVVAEIKLAEDDIFAIWQQVPYVTNLISNAASAIAEVKRIKAEIQDLEDTCIKLAAKAQTDSGKKVLQNLRQVQHAVDLIDGYQKQLQSIATLPAEAALRMNQLLQQLQRQILVSLATLQTMALPVASAELTDAAAAAGVTLSTFSAQVTKLANDLTAADSLITSAGKQPLEARIQQSFAKGGTPAVGNLLAGPLFAKSASIQKQLSDLRTLKLTVDPDNLSLKLLHYDLSLQLQSSFDVGLEWNIFANLNTVPAAVQSALAGLAKINAFADAVSLRISNAIASSLCPLKTVWANFPNNLKNTNASVYNLFKPSLDGVTQALDKLCSDSSVTPPIPSVLVADGRNVLAAFQALLNDVRTRVTSLSNVPQEVLTLATQKLNEIVQNIPVPKSVTLSYDWHPQIQPFEPVFLLNDGADFVVSARAEISLPLPGANPPSFDITATLTNFSINLIGNPSFVIVTINSLKFTSHNGSSPDCRIDIDTVTFGQDMSFVKSLAEALNPSTGPFIELADGAIKAGYRFAVDSLPTAGMTVMGLAIEVAVALPFNGDPVRCEFGISDQQHPFLLSFGIYGGGGFLQLQLGLDGVQLLQGALEFGLVSSITIGPLKGSGFIVGGIYFRIGGGSAKVCGFVHAHGHMDIFGIISLDVDLYVGVCYLNGVVTGTATFSVHVSILFFSEDFSLQASYTFGGSGGASQSRLEPYLDPRFDEGALASAAFLVSPGETGAGPQQPNSTPDPVFISKHDWVTYLNAFDLDPQGAQP
jgi:hypothetical protein